MTWADAFGIWHADVSFVEVGDEERATELATQAITEQIAMRQAAEPVVEIELKGVIRRHGKVTYHFSEV